MLKLKIVVYITLIRNLERLYLKIQKYFPSLSLLNLELKRKESYP